VKIAPKTRLFATLILGGYFGLGMITRATGEVFPVFGWFLYALVPQQQTHYSALLVEMDDGVLPEPVLFQDAHALVPSTRELTPLKMMDQLGKTIESKDGRAADLRHKLEGSYLPRVKRYKIVKITYKPLEYWKTKAHERTEIAAFEVNTP
jgi:hypothetical protein